MPISELLPPRVAVNREVLEKLSDQELMQVSIQLYREASLTIQACAQNHAPAKLTDRSRAICCGLLVRLGKYMLAVDTLVTHQDSCADVLMAINRSMFESAVNVTYLLHVDTPEVYEDFVKKGLGPEREYHDLVQQNIAERGGVMTPMEDRILQSILRVIERSGVKIEDVPVKHQEWGVNMREKIKEIGWDGMYVPYRIGSHAVHGSWVDVLMRHLVYSDEGFSVEWSFGFTDSRLLNSSARLNLEAAGYYAGRWFEAADRDAVFERLEPLIDDLEAVSHATELAVQRD